jgi:transcription initiation factor IIE alpha subunit
MNYSMTTTTTTKATKVIAALENGTELTAKQISARYGVKNVRALMSSLRMQGYPVYLNKRVSSFDGETTTYNKYSLGTPTRAVIAAGYRAIAQGV